MREMGRVDSDIRLKNVQVREWKIGKLTVEVMCKKDKKMNHLIQDCEP